jgi:hypothetical protein
MMICKSWPVKNAEAGNFSAICERILARIGITLPGNCPVLLQPIWTLLTFSLQFKYFGKTTKNIRKMKKPAYLTIYSTIRVTN